MTAKHRAGSKPVAHDVRLTPLAVASACVGLLNIRPGMRVLDPSAGDGAWVRALREVHPGSNVWANELRPVCRPRLYEAMDGLPDGTLLGDGDGYQRALPSTASRVRIGRFESYLQRDGGFDVVVGNPPYTYAEEHVRHALYLLKPDGICAFLLGVTFRGSQGRRDLFWDSRWALWRQYMLEERPSFSADGRTDATEYVLFVFRKGYQGDEVVRSFSWRDPQRYEVDRQRIIALDWG